MNLHDIGAAVAAWLKDFSLGDALGVVGLVTGYYFFRKAQQVVRVSYERDETTVVAMPSNGFSEHIKISYVGNSVERLTVSHFTIWNSGSLTIRRSEISPSDPVRIVLRNDGQIFGVTVSNTTCAVTAAMARPDNDGRAAIIDFDFLDPQDGFVMSVVHSGNVGEIDLVGTVIGLPAGFKKVALQSSASFSAGIVTIVAMTASTSLVGMLSYFASLRPNDGLVRSGLSSVAAFGAAMTALALLITLVNRWAVRGIGWRRVPEALR